MHLRVGNTPIIRKVLSGAVLQMNPVNSGLKDHFKTTTEGYYMRKPKK